jgi:hypothetical protein
MRWLGLGDGLKSSCLQTKLESKLFMNLLHEMAGWFIEAAICRINWNQNCLRTCYMRWLGLGDGLKSSCLQTKLESKLFMNLLHEMAGW